MKNDKDVRVMQLLKVYIQETAMRLTSELVPLFFLTYVAHILRLQALGVQAGTYALIMITIAVFSTAIRMYAQNELNKMPPDKRGNSSFFWGVWAIQVIGLLVLATIIWGIIRVTDLPYTNIFRLQLLLYIGAILDISWLFNGINKTKVVVRRDALVQMLRFVPLIVFVKDPTDLSRFIILLAVTTIMANLLLWIRLPSVLVRVNMKILPVRVHMKSLGFFLAVSLLPQLALYMNKAVLFVTNGVESVAMYYSAELLVKVGVALVLGIAMAMMAQVTQQRQKGNSAGVEQSFYDAIEYGSALGVIVAVGVATVGPQAIYWFLGPDFANAGDALRILAFVIVVASWRYSLALQQMAAERGFRNVSAPVQVGAGINVVLTVLLVPVYGIVAAAWVALISELIALVLQVLLLRRALNIWQIVRVIWRYGIAGGIAALSILAIIHVVPGPYPKFSALEATVGLIAYIIVVFVFSTPVVRKADVVLSFALKQMVTTTIDFVQMIFRYKK